MALIGGPRRFSQRQRLGILVSLGVLLILTAGGLVTWAMVRGKASEVQTPVGDGLATAPKYLFSIHGDPQSGLLQPLAVTAGPDGDLYIADSGHAVIQVTDSSGRYKRTIGPGLPSSAGAQNLVYPVGVAVDASGNLYVSDATTMHVYRIDQNGWFAGFFGETGGVKRFEIPIGLSIWQDRLYLNDIGQQKVLVFNLTGELLTEVGTGKGGNQGQLNYANFSWIDDGGDIYVSDSNNGRVQVFDHSGKLITAILPQAAGLVRGIAVDDLDQIHVASVLDHRIDVFDRKGRLLFSYGQPGSGEGQFAFPNGLWISGKHLYVTDRENNRVQVWGIP